MYPTHYYIIAFVVFFLTFIVKGLVGFGEPLLYNPILTMFFPSSIIVPGISFITPVVNTMLVVKNKNQLNPKLVIPLAIVVILGAIPGTIVLSKFGTSNVLKLVLGIFIFLLGLEMLTRKDPKPRPIRWLICAPVAIISGFFGGLFAIDNIIVAYLERTAKNLDEFKANIGFVFIIETLFRIVMYYIGGLYTKDSLLLTLAAFPSAVPGMWLGMKLSKKIKTEVLKKLVVYLFILGGISITVYAVLALIGK